MDEENKEEEQDTDMAPPPPEPGEPETDGDEPALSEAERQLMEEMKEEGWDESTYFSRLFALKELEEEKRRVLVKQALAKFNFFLHSTLYLTGVAFLLIAGILYRPALPYLLIPIVLWTIGIGYHFYWAFFKIRKPGMEEKLARQEQSKPLGWIDEDSEDKGAGGPEEEDSGAGDGKD